LRCVGIDVAACPAAETKVGAAAANGNDAPAKSALRRVSFIISTFL
jgi:hypothetical protein